MKRVIALLLAIMLLPIFSVVGYAAEMSPADFKDVLLGNSTEITAEQGKADLIRAYRNISQDQLNTLKAYFDADSVNTSGITVPTGVTVITNEEAQILAYGFVKLMAFPNEKDGAISNNNIGDNDINRAVAAFCDNVTVGATTTSPNAVLNKLAGDKMTKNALGKLVLDLQKSLRSHAKADIPGFMAVFATADTGFTTAIEAYVKAALVDALNNTPANSELGLAIAAMQTTANGVLSNPVVAADPFIELILNAFVAMPTKELSVVFNTVMSGVMDAAVEVYANPTDANPIATVEPNGTIQKLYKNQAVYLKVISNEAKALTHEENLNLSLSSSLEGVVTNGVLDVSHENGFIKVAAQSTGDGILKLYRDVNNNKENNVPKADAQDLFMELNVSAQIKSSLAPTGPTEGTITPGTPTGGNRVDAPTISYEVTEDGKIIITLDTDTEGADIYYTTDGTTPDENSTKYEGPFEVEEGTTIKSIAIKDGDYADSYVTADVITLGGGAPTLTSEHIAYVHGRDTGNFDAEHSVTRGEVAAIFSRLIVKKMVFKDNSESAFNDVTDDAWYASYVKYLSNAGIIKGYEDGSFRPDSPISRAEFATVASRFFEVEKDAVSNFADVADDHWAKAFIDSAVAKEWLVGYEDGTFRPEQAIKRSETVTIVNRMLNRVADKAYITANLDSIITYPDLAEDYWAYYEILEASNWHDHKVENNVETWTNVFVGE